MCSQKVRLARHPLGMVTDCDSVSVWVAPYPSIQAYRVPEWAVCPLKEPMTPEVAVHGVVPDSKPGLPSCCPEQPPPVGLTVHVKDALPLALVVSLAVTVTLDVPVVVGVPLIRPVLEL